jgi:thimet oligopeptidase
MEPDFDFSNITVDLLKQYKDKIIKDTTNTINHVVKLKGERTFHNTVQPLINNNTILQPYKSSFTLATDFHTDKYVRECATELKQEVDKFLIDVSMRRDLYNTHINYQNGEYKREEEEILIHEENRYFEHTMREFKRNGLHLNEDDYNSVKNMLKEISDMETKYQNNLNEENTWFEMDEKDLDGMPEFWFTSDRLLREDNNIKYYKVTLKYPDFFPAMDYIKSSEVRKKLYTAYNLRCWKENSELLEKTIKLRYEVAKKLGYATHADYRTEINIIKDATNAFNFENGMSKRFNPMYEKDMKTLLNFAKHKSSNMLHKASFDQWDYRYYIREYTEQECDINMEEVREYFPLQTVKDGLFKIYQTLLGLIFTEINTTNKWHEDVSLYRVNDKKNNNLLGYFYLDLHPREGKYGHAAAFDFITGCDVYLPNGNHYRRKHVMAVACNFAKDGCIDFDDVETFFHEFGHVMHQICSNPQIMDFAGFEVERDFVEAPSQFLEYFCYEPETLQLMSKNIPIDIVKKLKKKKNFLCSYHYKRQLMLGLFDLRIHTLTNFDNINLQDIWYEIQKDVMKIDTELKLYNFAGFGHLMGSYDSCYYGYLRAETYAANIFHKMFAGNVLNPQMGMRYRNRLLEPGATRDSLELLEDFLGEKTDDSYFLKEKGLHFC